MRLHLPAWLALTAFLLIQPGCITKRHIPVDPQPAAKAEPAPAPQPAPEPVQEEVKVKAEEEDLVVVPAMGGDAQPQPAAVEEVEVSEVDLNGELQDLREKNGDVTAPAETSASGQAGASQTSAAQSTAEQSTPAQSAPAQSDSAQSAAKTKKDADLQAAAQQTVEGGEAENGVAKGAPVAPAMSESSSDDMLADGPAEDSAGTAPVDTVVVAQGETVTETVTEADDTGKTETVVAQQTVASEEVIERADILPEEGVAARISGSLEGRPTASGKVYSSGELVAAHNTLPMGTRVLVQNLDNGRSTTVTVIDRGPLVATRVMDVSAAAAKALGIPVHGTSRVRLSRPGAQKVADQMMSDQKSDARKTSGEKTDGTANQTLAAPTGAYYVQVGALAQTHPAQDQVAKLKESGYVGSRVMTVEKKGTVWHRVQAGAFATADEARKAKDALSAEYPGCFIYRD